MDQGRRAARHRPGADQRARQQAEILDLTRLVSPRESGHLTAMTAHEDLPYRPCVGVMVINRDGLVFVGRRIGGQEHVDATHSWQMPQGGIDDGEDPWDAALRELYEETNIRSVEKLGEAPHWLSYDLPPIIAGQAWKGRYRGQTQKWYALRFTGDDSEIDIAQPAGGHKPEFLEWRWETARRLPGLIIPFKRKVYEDVLAAFAPLLK
jgi:putative (di)nucleoside polyphosphate hydrolase